MLLHSIKKMKNLKFADTRGKLLLFLINIIFHYFSEHFTNLWCLDDQFHLANYGLEFVLEGGWG